jgi:hypothetical protein
MSRKQPPLCKNHYDEFDDEKYSDIDTVYLSEVLGFLEKSSTCLKQVFVIGSVFKHKKYCGNKKSKI